MRQVGSEDEWLAEAHMKTDYSVLTMSHFEKTVREYASFLLKINKISIICGNQQRCLYFWLLLEDQFEQLSGIVKNVDRHGRTALFLIMTDSCLIIVQ